MTETPNPSSLSSIPDNSATLLRKNRRQVTFFLKLDDYEYPTNFPAEEIKRDVRAFHLLCCEVYEVTTKNKDVDDGEEIDGVANGDEVNVNLLLKSAPKGLSNAALVAYAPTFLDGLVQKYCPWSWYEENENVTDNIKIRLEAVKGRLQAHALSAVQMEGGAHAFEKCVKVVRSVDLDTGYPDGFPVDQLKQDIRSFVVMMRQVYTPRQGDRPEVLDETLKNSLKSISSSLLRSFNRRIFLRGQVCMFCDADDMNADQWVRLNEVIGRLVDHASSFAFESKSHRHAFEDCVRAVRSEDFKVEGKTQDSSLALEENPSLHRTGNPTASGGGHGAAASVVDGQNYSLS